MEHHDFDVVVAGCGVAGLSAATAAVDAGARVAVLERATYDERGGNTRYTAASMRMKSEDAVSDDFESFLVNNCGYHVQPDFAASTALDYANWSPLVRALPFTDPELISFFVEGVPPTISWMKEHGVRFGGIGFYGLTPRPTPRIAVTGGGLAIVETLTDYASRKGVQFFYEVTAQELERGDDGSICGLRATRNGSQAMLFRARAVVLACGGFEGNPEMVVRYLGPKGRYLRPVARGGYYNKGEGIAMALRAGAAPAGDFAGWHAQPIDPRSGKSEPLVMAYPYGVLVNRAGQRFLDEAPGTIDANYEEATRTIAEQHGGIAYCLLDSRFMQIENWQRCIRSDQPPESGPDFVSLGRKLGFDGAAAQRTVDAYNAACRPGSFDHSRLDGLTTVGLTPPKSNYARPLDTAPYYAYPVIASNTFTFGGLKVNTNAQVVAQDGSAMPGLYAAGETVGLYYGKYPGATSVLRGAVFGRRAGEHAASLRG